VAAGPVMVGGENIDQAGRHHLPGQLLRSGTGALIMTIEASHIDLKQCPKLLPRAQHVEGLHSWQVPVALRMGDDDLPS